MSYSSRVVQGVDYGCGRELWVSEAPAQCSRNMVRLAGVGGLAQATPGDQIALGLGFLIGASAIAGAIQGAVIGAVAAGRGRRGKGAGYGALTGAAMNAILLGAIMAPTIAKTQQGA